jgi:Fip1 motif
VINQNASNGLNVAEGDNIHGPQNQQQKPRSDIESVSQTENASYFGEGVSVGTAPQSAAADISEWFNYGFSEETFIYFINQ